MKQKIDFSKNNVELNDIEHSPIDISLLISNKQNEIS
jgi:hypothetical protein